MNTFDQAEHLIKNHSMLREALNELAKNPSRDTAIVAVARTIEASNMEHSLQQQKPTPLSSTTRKGDMGAELLQLTMDSENDMVITVVNPNTGQHLSVEFCTYHGGGKSLNTREALLNLFAAMQRDQKEQGT